jgi:hypothetical protein
MPGAPKELTAQRTVMIEARMVFFMSDLRENHICFYFNILHVLDVLWALLVHAVINNKNTAETVIPDLVDANFSLRPLIPRA